MALDKLVDGTQLDSDLASVADAIRAKGGTSAQLAFPAEFVSAVQAIQTGITPTGTINIDSNGTYDVTDKATAVVNVPGGVTPTGTKQISITENGTTTEDVAAYANAQITVNVPTGGSGEGYVAADWLDVTKPVGEIVSSVSDLSIVTFKSHTGITRLSFPNATTIPINFCSDCANLAEITAPMVTSVLANAFMNTTAMVNPVHFPNAIFASNAFNNSRVPIAVFRGMNSATRTFAGDVALTAVDQTGVSTIGNVAFERCSALGIIILRGSSVSALSAIGAFNVTPFASGRSGGTLYVPQALISSYQSAANWSTILGYGGGAQNKILPIEGSIYETQYADGTPIPAA